MSIIVERKNEVRYYVKYQLGKGLPIKKIHGFNISIYLESKIMKLRDNVFETYNRIRINLDYVYIHNCIFYWEDYNILSYESNKITDELIHIYGEKTINKTMNILRDLKYDKVKGSFNINNMNSYEFRLIEKIMNTEIDFIDKQTLECCVCYDMCCNFIEYCKHIICLNCLVKVKKCPICRILRICNCINCSEAYEFDDLNESY